MLLAGDLGGTKTNLAIYSAENGPRYPLAEANYTSAKYSGLDEIVTIFLEKFPLPVDRACFGVAGPVIGSHASITNIGWEMSEGQLESSLGLKKVRLINDLVAIGTAIPNLAEVDLATLNEGEPVEHGNIGVLAPGTGLGEAFLVWDGNRYVAHPSEGGHTDFAPNNRLEIDLLKYLFERFGHVSYERVASGSGVPNIYDFLKDTGQAEEPAWLAAELAQVTDRTPVIINAALDDERWCQICHMTLNMFVDVLASETSNLALQYLATGGIYMGGGIPPRILSALKRPEFIDTYLHKGRFAKFLKRVPVHVVLNPKAALFGAACYGLEMVHG
jgi:glucokinase